MKYVILTPHDEVVHARGDTERDAVEQAEELTRETQKPHRVYKLIATSSYGAVQTKREPDPTKPTLRDLAGKTWPSGPDLVYTTV